MFMFLKGRGGTDSVVNEEVNVDQTIYRLFGQDRIRIVAHPVQGLPHDPEDLTAVVLQQRLARRGGRGRLFQGFESRINDKAQKQRFVRCHPKCHR